MNGSDNVIIFEALNMWANLLETGDVSMSRKSAKLCGKEHILRDLDMKQAKSIKRLRDLATETLQKDT